jgi:hypothetical protein
MKTETNFYEKLAAVKAEVGRISKDSSNPFFKSKYFDVNSLLLHVEPIIQKNGLLLLQPIQDNLVKSIIFDTNGFSIESGIVLPELNDPQKLGSAITYYRRYTLQSLLALQAEDDDANLASNRVDSKNSKPGAEVTEKELSWLNKNTPQYSQAIEYLMKGGKLETIESKYKLSKSVKDELLKIK